MLSNFGCDRGGQERAMVKYAVVAISADFCDRGWSG